MDLVLWMVSGGQRGPTGLSGKGLRPWIVVKGALDLASMILALPASGRPLGATVSGSVILERHRTEPRPALDFQEPHQALIKRSFSKENLHLSASQCGDPLRILDSGFEEDLPVLGGLAQDPKSKIQDPRSPPPPPPLSQGLGSWILDSGFWI